LVLFFLVSPLGSVVVLPSEITTSVNTTVSLICVAGGGPDNIFEWSQNGVIITRGNRPFLSIPIVTGGMYQCTVINNAGSDSSTASVIGKHDHQQ